MLLQSQLLNSGVEFTSCFYRSEHGMDQPSDAAGVEIVSKSSNVRFCVEKGKGVEIDSSSFCLARSTFFPPRRDQPHRLRMASNSTGSRRSDLGPIGVPLILFSKDVPTN
jgi:hypothetical protein